MIRNRKAIAGLDFDCAARRDFRYYVMGVFGVAFVLTGLMVDPARNCSSDGECAPWLVHVAFWMGVVVTAGVAAAFWRNPRRGSRVDMATRSLIWWNEMQGPARHSVPLDDVAVIRIDDGSDNTTLSLLRADGTRLPFPRDEVIPWPFEEWANAVAARFPHIAVQVVK